MVAVTEFVVQATVTVVTLAVAVPLLLVAVHVCAVGCVFTSTSYAPLTAVLNVNGTEAPAAPGVIVRVSVLLSDNTRPVPVNPVTLPPIVKARWPLQCCRWWTCFSGRCRRSSAVLHLQELKSMICWGSCSSSSSIWPGTAVRSPVNGRQLLPTHSFPISRQLLLDFRLCTWVTIVGRISSGWSWEYYTRMLSMPLVFFLGNSIAQSLCCT